MLKMKNFSFLSLLIFCFFLALPSFAVEGKFSGVVLSQYQNPLGSTTANNGFDVTRMYLTYLADLGSGLKMRYTGDVFRPDKVGGGKERLVLFNKYAWLEADGIIADGKIRFGLIELPWIGFEEGIWGYRMQGSIFVDREGLITSADLGVGVLGKIGDRGDYVVTLTNGEGYANPESNNTKMIQARYTHKLTPQVSLSIFGQNNYYGSDPSLMKNRYLGQIAYKDKQMVLAGDYITTSDKNSSASAQANGAGFSVFGTYKVLDLWELIARYDSYNPDNNIANDTHVRYIAGISYELSKSVKLLLDADRLVYDSGAGTNQTFAYLHVEVKF